MIKYAPNISWVFADRPLPERLRMTAEAGFDGFEFGFYGQFDIDEINRLRKKHNLSVVLFNMNIPDWGPGRRGYLADPVEQDGFRYELEASLKIVQKLDSQKLMLPVGATLGELSVDDQKNSVIENLCYAAKIAEEAGVILTIEALNLIDVPDYFLSSSALGIDIVQQVDHPSVRFQFDTYHLDTGGEDLFKTLQENIEFIGHIQFGDSPGRTEPGYGRLNFEKLITETEKAGYDGFVGLEYIPVSKGMNAIKWVTNERKEGLVSGKERAGIRSSQTAKDGG